MNNKKIIIGIIFLIVGILIIITAFLFKNKDQNFANLKFTNLQIIDGNSFTIDVTNLSKDKILNQQVMLYLEDEEKNLIMTTPLEIEKLDSQETLTLNYYQEDLFNKKPTSFYVKEYTGKEEIIKNISLESIFSNLLKEKAKMIIEENFTLENFTSLTLTANDMEKKYQKDLGDFKNKQYNCSLNDSFVEITLVNNNYSYVAYLDCEIFQNQQ